MPDINRIRVNNVKYNFGTQGYDDFSMRMYGKNTLYDLANGGGKSVLMLLLLQNLIPNCTLDEKQPIEKLFRNGGGNTTIHSLIEWRLDDKDIQEGFRYMTTGFCARKAKDTDGQLALEDMATSEKGTGTADAGAGQGGSTAKRDSASIEYFNYCIFYREYNENDIVNLPLQNSRERITYTGLKSYLRDLSRRNRNLKVYIFEGKGEYQRFISRYGLFGSQWEIIRGINKTEGHVRTYFESHYKTTRKVVEDLLIEEIIEKAFLVKTEQDDVNEDMARTLLGIRDKLVELSKKKKEISHFDKESELMQLLEGRVASFLELYEEKDAVERTLADIYVTGRELSGRGEAQIARMEEQRAAQNERYQLEQKRIECLKIVRDRYEAEALKESLGTLERHVKKAEEEYRLATEERNRKESMNDYLRYLEDKASMEENVAILQAAAESDTDPLAKLCRYAFTKKQMDDEKIGTLRRQLEARRKELEAAEKQAGQQSRIYEEEKIALAVAVSHRDSLSAAYERRMEEIRNVRQDISVLMLGDVRDLMSALEEEEQELRLRIEEKEQQYYGDVNAVSEAEHALLEKKQRYAKISEQMAHAEERHGQYLKNQERLQKMLQVYGVSEPSMLHDAIWERAFQNRIRMEERKKETARVNRHLEQIREGRILEESPAVTKIKDYLESRHGEFALSGVDYLSALPRANREELLNRFPMLPYGIVTDRFELIEEDERIDTLDLGSMAVPVYDRKVLESPYIPEGTKGVLLIAKDKSIFLEEEALAAELARLVQRRTELQEELSHFSELEAAYEEDLDDTAKLTDAAFLNAEREILERRETVLELKREIKEAEGFLEGLRERRDRIKAEQDADRETLAANEKEQKKLLGIKAVSDLADETQAQLEHYRAEVKRLEEEVEQAGSRLSDAELRREELAAQTVHMEGSIREILEDWETLYLPYYPEQTEHIRAVSMPEEQLKAEFLAAKAVAEKETMALEDKKKLIAALSESMKRCLRMVEKRGISVEELEHLRMGGELHPVEEEYLNRMDMHLSQISVRVEQLKEEYRKKEQGITRLEGRMEQAAQALCERFGEHVLLMVDQMSGTVQGGLSQEPDGGMPCQPVTKQEAEQAIQEGSRILGEIRSEMTAFQSEYHQYVKNHGILLDLYKDIRRIIEKEQIDVGQANVLSKSQEELKSAFEESLLSYDRSNKALSRARQELLNYKAQTANVFFTMGAYELSASIKEDVEVPETYAEAKELLGSIREMVSYIALEKERVAQGIEDMETIKNNFENQCIERCRDVRTELDKLPALSRIQLDGETIQMVSLTIPYVKDEFIKQRMSDYIDGVVNGAEQFTENSERMKYIKNRLLLKKLFSVLVTDMNAIKLKLYKRERMKEQSRYLRYEEAVGSTGQSQGIYIQFLVSVINYISGMYAPGVEPADLKKVIFIDNPFGAAKDIYIWEPIFALLNTNHVQLIVPARGATPAITNRFDVNYILGQRLENGRQQTVVVDYRSQVAQEEIEYQNLEYSQGTFDFI